VRKNLRVNAEDLRARLEAGEPATILDARGQRAYEASGEKIPGAIRVDEENLYQVAVIHYRQRFTAQ
jgi:rhodanese-related sulfurtransferase